jgi:hypothetical protein
VELEDVKINRIFHDDTQQMASNHNNNFSHHHYHEQDHLKVNDENNEAQDGNERNAETNLSQWMKVHQSKIIRYIRYLLPPTIMTTLKVIFSAKFEYDDDKKNSIHFSFWKFA